MTNAGYVVFVLDCNSSSVGVFLGSCFVSVCYDTVPVPVPVPVYSREQTKTQEDTDQTTTLSSTHTTLPLAVYTFKKQLRTTFHFTFT
jgi:hypothetical protein